MATAMPSAMMSVATADRAEAKAEEHLRCGRVGTNQPSESASLCLSESAR